MTGFDPHDASSQGNCQMYHGRFDPHDSSSQGSCPMYHGGFDPHDSFSQEAESVSGQLGFNRNNVGLLFMISNNT